MATKPSLLEPREGERIEPPSSGGNQPTPTEPWRDHFTGTIHAQVMPADSPDQAEPRDIRATIPNLLTIARLGLAALVIASLSMYQHPISNLWALPAAAALFVVAAITDALDGHLARKWNVVSLFGRVMDPFADKALVLGAFVVLAGPGFADSLGHPASGVTPWMVVVLLARELFVTSIRGVMESSGVSFGANWAGKAKMILQSFAVPAILLLLWIGPKDMLLNPARPTQIALDTIVWVTLVATAISGAPYVVAAVRVGARP